MPTLPQRTVLPNGLVVLTAEEHRSPLAAVLIIYRSGSRDEPHGKTGLAHLTEHMMFRGTPAYPLGAVDVATGRLGGTNNAVTTADYTAYYFVLPGEHWREALVMEADRMANCSLDRGPFEMERGVAVEERKMLDDDPEAMLDEAVAMLAYTRHPYRYPVIGLRSDIEALTLEDVAWFYRAFYQPGNAVLVVAGDVDGAAVRDAAEAAFGSIPSSGVPASLPDPEPRQLAPRRASLQTTLRTREVVLAFHCPPADAEDSAALELVAALLATGRSSRLWRRLVMEERIAAEVSAVRLLNRDPGLFTISATLHPGVDLGRAEEAVLDVIDGMRRDGVPGTELAKAKSLVSVDLLLARETDLGLAGALGFWESLGGWELGQRFEGLVESARPEDVSGVLARYLSPDSRNSVWLMHG